MDYAKATDNDIPPAGTRNADRDWTEYARVMQESPGDWFELTDHGMSTAYLRVTGNRIRRGLLKAFRPDGAFEVRTRGNRLWARFVGEVAAN